jgi:hypothetical protein
MNNKIAIYLAGSIKKGHERADESFWTDDDVLLLKKYLTGYEVSFLNPAFRSDNLSDQRSTFGRDMIQVFCSDVVFVDARDRRGLGVGAEMMWAKFHRIPIVTLAPKNSHYNKSKTTLLGMPVENWIHPFVDSLSDAIVENLNEGATWIRRFIGDSAPEVRGIEYIESAMRYYRGTQLSHDGPMKALLEANNQLHKRVTDLEERFATPQKSDATLK